MEQKELYTFQARLAEKTPTIVPIGDHADSRGLLRVVENLPFDVKRVFWIEHVPRWEHRAGHGHSECEQIIICVRGHFVLQVGLHQFTLCGSDSHGVHVPVNNIVMLAKFSDDAIALVLCSHEYNPSEVIEREDEIHEPVQ